jgi:pimeloyl-ACP methyl ester carboxylesterase
MSPILKKGIPSILVVVLFFSLIGCTPGGSYHYADVNDIKIFYWEFGERQSGETVLLLHGGFAFGETWMMQIPELAKKYRVIVPDSRGHGRTSDSKEPISYALMADDMVQLLSGLDIEHAHVIGWSDGGVIGLHLAIDYPEIVDKLVLLGTPYHVDNYSPAVYDALVSTLQDLREGKALKLTFKGLTTIPLDARSIYEVLSPDPGHWTLFVDKMTVMWLNSPTFTPEELKTIEAPTLVISVDHDEYLSPEVFQTTASSIPCSTLGRIPKGSHSVAIEYPSKVNRMITDFLDAK